jgi:hypothetical protein
MRRRQAQRAAALVEFALAWPVAMLVVVASVEAAVWAAEAYAAHSAALAGAEAGSGAGASRLDATRVALRSLSASLVGTVPSEWCPSAPAAQEPAVWVCTIDLGGAIEVDVGGTAPALVPMGPGGGLPLRAHVVLPKEAFRT